MGFYMGVRSFREGLEKSFFKLCVPFYVEAPSAQHGKDSLCPTASDEKTERARYPSS